MPMQALRRSKPLLLATVLALLAVASLASPAWAQDPPGNNGTVKIDDVPFDDLPNNEPHVGCTFQVDFYGYDEGDLDATVTFEAHPPTLRAGDDQVLLTDTVFIGEDDNSGGGSEAGLDASETYTLDFTGITPHPVQGFHVKLTINAEGSQGADVKHKVFWVTGCAPAPTTTTVAPSTTATTVCPTTTTAGPTTTTTGGATTTTAGPTTTTAGGTTTTTGGATTTTAAPTTTTVKPTTTTAAPTTTTVKPTTTTAAPTTTTVKPTTSTDKPTTSSRPYSLTAAGESSTTHGATTTVPPTTIPTSTSGAATTTTGCPDAAGISAGLTSDTSPFDATGALPLAASVLVLLSIGATSVMGWRRRRL
jgi:hypothetical protein